MEQHLGRQSGVQKVKVSLIDGKVEITPKPDGRIEPSQLLKATYDSGVSVAEMSIIARGQIVKSASGALVFQVQSNQSFTIAQNDLAHQLTPNTYITVKGLLYQKEKGQKKRPLPTAFTLTIQEIQAKE